MAAKRILYLAVALAGMSWGAAGRLRADDGGSQQCYWEEGVDPPNSCNTCSKTCLGAGYKCCTIQVQ